MILTDSKWEPITRFITVVYALLFAIDGATVFHLHGTVYSFYIGILIACAFLSTLILMKDEPKSGYIFICAFTLLLTFGFWYGYSIRFTFYPLGFMFMASITTFTICGLSCLKYMKDTK